MHSAALPAVAWLLPGIRAVPEYSAAGLVCRERVASKALLHRGEFRCRASSAKVQAMLLVPQGEPVAWTDDLVCPAELASYLVFRAGPAQAAVMAWAEDALRPAVDATPAVEGAAVVAADNTEAGIRGSSPDSIRPTSKDSRSTSRRRNTRRGCSNAFPNSNNASRRRSHR